MMIKPSPPRPELEEHVRKAKEWMENATPEEKEEMFRKQRESIVRAEMNWPRDCPYR